MSCLWILATFVMIIVFPAYGTAMASDPSMIQVNSLQELVDGFDSSSCRECHEQIRCTQKPNRTLLASIRNK